MRATASGHLPPWPSSQHMDSPPGLAVVHTLRVCRCCRSGTGVVHRQSPAKASIVLRWELPERSSAFTNLALRHPQTHVCRFSILVLHRDGLRPGPDLLVLVTCAG